MRQHYWTADHTYRNQIIVKLRKQGFSYQYIGDKFGISRERVRQVLKKEGVIPNTPPETQILYSYEKSELLSMSDIAFLVGKKRTVMESQRKFNQFPEPIGKMRGKKSDGKTCLFNYWDKKVIYKWLEGRFEEIKDQLSQSIRYHITVKGYKISNPRVMRRTNKLNFLSSKPFSENHWVGHLTKSSVGW